MISLKKTLKFNQLLYKLQQVERITYAPNGNRLENDAEHSFQLAMLCWYFANSSDDFNLDIEEVLRYALAHIVVEAYAGDTPLHEVDKEEKIDKEHQALEKISEEFPEFSDLHEVITAYENQADDEAKFVNAVDKLVPLINCYFNEGRSWKEYNISLEDVYDLKDDEFDDVPKIKAFYKNLIEIVAKDEEKFFNTIT